jgi:hypothetical protein
VLRRPDWDRPFILTTDYSKAAIGAILSQKDEEGREYVIAYASKKLGPLEANYSASEGECFAVVHHVTHTFRPYLLGRRFTVLTDHHLADDHHKLHRAAGPLGASPAGV